MIARRSSRQAALAAMVLGLSVAALALPARAADAGDDRPWDSKMIGNLLEGLGLQSPNKDPIVYQERAPLVIPPSTDLPTPEKTDAAIASNPAWPKDPDVARKKEAARQARIEAMKSADEKFREENRVLSPSEMTPNANGANRMPRVGTGNRTANTFSESNQKLTPSQLGYNGGMFGSLFGGKNDDEQARFTGEPPRASLTDPPAGYQTPSADQPYGSGSERNRAPKATNYLESKGGDIEH
ncbi:MAG: hypothetical protein KIT76_13010 [Pseudolabrys sp.]|jgi:hypothetical protein|nr:hypothetical protein [Pseudolabrys sp.]